MGEFFWVRALVYVITVTWEEDYVLLDWRVKSSPTPQMNILSYSDILAGSLDLYFQLWKHGAIIAGIFPYPLVLPSSPNIWSIQSAGNWTKQVVKLGSSKSCYDSSPTLPKKLLSIPLSIALVNLIWFILHRDWWSIAVLGQFIMWLKFAPVLPKDIINQCCGNMLCLLSVYEYRYLGNSSVCYS